MFLSDQHLPLPLTYLSHQAAASPGGGSRAMRGSALPAFSRRFPLLPMVSHGFPSRRFPPSSSVNLIPSVSCSFRAAGGAMCSFRAAGGAMCAFRAAGGAMCAFRAAGGAMCAFRAAGGAMCAFRAAGGAMCAFRAAGGAMCSFRAAGGAMCAFRAAGGEMCLFRAAGGAMCLFRAAGGAICSFRAAGGAMCSFRAAGGAMCTFRAAGGAMCAFRAAGGAMCSFRAACGAMCAFRAAGAACCFFPDSRPFLPLYEERMTVAPPPASQPITDGHVAGQVGNGAARREAREVAEHSSLLPCAHLCSPALTSAPLRSPLLPCAHLCSPALTSGSPALTSAPCTHLCSLHHLCSPALTSAPCVTLSPALTSAPCAHLCSLRSPLLPALTSAPCAHLCSPALTSAPLHSPLLPCSLCSPALTFTVHPTFHTTVSPVPHCSCHCFPAPLFTPLFPRPQMFTPLFLRPPLFTPRFFSPLFTHLLFPLFPLFTPLPSRLLAMLPALTCYAPSPHSLIAQNSQPGEKLPLLTRGISPPPPLPCRPSSTCFHSLHVWEREVEHVSGGELQRFAVGVVWEREVEHLSGGELQRFAIGVVAGQLGDIYMFDEPSSYLDVRQRLKAAQVIRSLLRPDRYVIVVEHDLSVLDYLSDFICCLYGKPGAYGVVTLPFSVREGINIFLAGFVPTENLRFRDESLTFRVAETPVDNPEEAKTYTRYKYPRMVKKQGGFKLTVEPGDFTDSQIVVMLGENGTGKTTFIRMLAGLLKADPDEETGKEAEDLPEFNVSYKPQKISPKFPHSVRALLHSKIRDSFHHPQFNTDVLRPMQIDPLLDQEVVNLSGGELQRVAITLCLGKPADIYLIDEPSAYLDSEQRIVAAKVIKRFILHAKKTAFVVEHDFIMATYLADRVIVYEGQPSVDCTARTPQSLNSGMNLFLSQLDITFRRDPTNFRPRINKMDSVKDREQKSAGTYYYLDD
ncbi:unnamed protein product [Closterium sp. NIES-64]|nr:unnamed protein product [Closterium sp. NIES-64]